MGTRKLVCVCDTCDTELDMKFHEGDDGEVVFVIEPCEWCRNEAFLEGCEVGYAYHMELEHRQDERQGGNDVGSESQSQ